MSTFRLDYVSITVAIWLVGSWSLVASGQPISMSQKDFFTPGTQPGSLDQYAFSYSAECRGCHGDFDTGNEPFATWQGSLMAMAGRDPLFFAQMTTANQDVANVGSYCLRCHVPNSIITGSANDPSGASLNSLDVDGVSCHFCHSMVDPVYKPGISPERDSWILGQLEDVPSFYGNAMLVIDPVGTRRGPYMESAAPHVAIGSAFHRSGDYCGSCHDVGNLAVTKQPDGTYRYNTIGEESPTSDPHGQFPLERTYTEWKLSAFANGGVDMGGRFGGDNATVVSTCQDCHMPRTTGQGCYFGPERDDLARHDFAGASAWVLEIIGEYYKDMDDPDVDQGALLAGRQKAIEMLQRAATVEVEQHNGLINVRVINETGHKLPTGHIEGRRVWINVRMLDGDGGLLREYGHYDEEEAHLDEASTTVFEMHVGLSAAAAAATGYSEGVTTHMALADTIEKDNRIPPRGFNNELYNAGGAPAVGAAYADEQHWSDVRYFIPDGASRIEVHLFYATATRHYIEALRDANHTDHWGNTLYNLWLRTNKGAPILMTTAELGVSPFVRGDLDDDGVVGSPDLSIMLSQWGDPGSDADLNGDGVVDTADLGILIGSFGRVRN
ncbi:MAG: hypothetical protein H6814_08800 [Phycisphaeraceae bacterium]|nr:hypothetical protein [Phycisphaeraceae bacterium]